MHMFRCRPNTMYLMGVGHSCVSVEAVQHYAISSVTLSPVLRYLQCYAISSVTLSPVLRYLQCYAISSVMLSPV